VRADEVSRAARVDTRASARIERTITCVASKRISACDLIIQTAKLANSSAPKTLVTDSPPSPDWKAVSSGAVATTSRIAMSIRSRQTTTTAAAIVPAMRAEGRAAAASGTTSTPVARTTAAAAMAPGWSSRSAAGRLASGGVDTNRLARPAA
jgi:hypothetical protein